MINPFKFGKNNFFGGKQVLFVLVVVFVFTDNFAKSKNISVESTSTHKSSASVNTKPQKIISASVVSDEILWLLLNDDSSRRRIAALSVLADNPMYSHISNEVKNVPTRVGGALEPLLALKPDIAILAPFNRKELVKQIEAAGIKTLILGDLRDFESIEKAIKDVAEIIEEKEKGEVLITTFREKLKKIAQQRKHSKKKIKILAWSFDNTVFGVNTLLDSSVTAMGEENILSHLKASSWPRLSREVLATLNPDCLLIAGNESEKENLMNRLSKQEHTKNWAAVKKKQVLVVPSRYLSAASPYITEGIEWMQKRMKNFD